MVYGVCMTRTQIMLTPTLKIQIGNYAKEENLSFSAAVRNLIGVSLSKMSYPKKNKVKGLFKLIENAGKGPKDLSTNDKLLYRL